MPTNTTAEEIRRTAAGLMAVLAVEEAGAQLVRMYGEAAVAAALSPVVGEARDRVARGDGLSVEVDGVEVTVEDVARTDTGRQRPLRRSTTTQAAIAMFTQGGWAAGAPPISPASTPRSTPTTATELLSSARPWSPQWRAPRGSQPGDWV